jgi:hypothetical protein
MIQNFCWSWITWRPWLNTYRRTKLKETDWQDKKLWLADPSFFIACNFKYVTLLSFCYCCCRHHRYHHHHLLFLLLFLLGKKLILKSRLFNKIFLGYQPCRLVKRRKNQRFKDHLCPRHERGTQAGLYLMRTDSPDTSVPWRRGQRWSFKRWFFRRLTNWHGW